MNFFFTEWLIYSCIVILLKLFITCTDDFSDPQQHTQRTGPTIGMSFLMYLHVVACLEFIEQGGLGQSHP